MLFDQIKVNQILHEKKRVRGWSGFRPKENHRGLIAGSGFLTDTADVFIPGMTLQIEWRVGAVVNDCLITFSIFQLAGSIRRRAYQLEICPRDKRSHNGEEAIYGPHEHLPDNEVRAVYETGVDCANWDGSVDWFLARTNIESFVLEQPC